MPSLKIAEALKLHAILPERYSAPTIHYNGISATTGSGHGWDTQGYKSADIALMVGTIQGAVATLTTSLLESDQDNPMLAIPITSANFTDRNSANDETTEEVSLLLAGRRRYLFLKSDLQDAYGNTATTDWSSVAIFGQADSEPVSKTLKFDL